MANLLGSGSWKAVVSLFAFLVGFFGIGQSAFAEVQVNVTISGPNSVNVSVTGMNPDESYSAIIVQNNQGGGAPDSGDNSPVAIVPDPNDPTAGQAGDTWHGTQGPPAEAANPIENGDTITVTIVDGSGNPVATASVEKSNLIRDIGKAIGSVASALNPFKLFYKKGASQKRWDSIPLLRWETFSLKWNLDLG